jgi:dipeptidyl aminopeptidase/acylaminoacyl peptidase
MQTTNQALLRGTLVQENKSEIEKPGTLFIHGWKSDERRYLTRAEALAKLGFICLTFNLRGHGTSDGKLEHLTIADHLKDSIAAYDFLASQQSVKKEAIHIVGASYGGYLTALLSSKRPAVSLVMRAPALYSNIEFNCTSDQRQKNRLANFALSVREGETAQNNMALKAVSQFPGDILLIESQHDQTIRHDVIVEYLLSANRERINHEIIRDADHSLSNEVWKQNFIDLLVRWFEKYSKI